ncbi:MAG: hypothetical protein ABR947_12845 [Solirubrobacteraceae bacterium]
MSVADQFLFGYDDGYRLLTGSRELDPQTLVTLLGATDAQISEGGGPLLTALALPGAQDYAFCVTWSAPEAPRPGAVWAHALVVSAAVLADERCVAALVGLPRRPAAGASDFESYRVAVELERAGVEDGAGGGAGWPGARLAAGAPDAALLARLASAAYDSDERLVAHGDTAGAARALVALWRAQWPALRAAFSFRVREVAREGASAFDLTVARRIRGREGDAAANDVADGSGAAPAWLRAVCEDAGAAAATPLRDFLVTFGPFEPSEPGRLRALAKLWISVAARDAQGAREALARDWAAAGAGAMLKRTLFDRANDAWWSGGAGSRGAAGDGQSEP